MAAQLLSTNRHGLPRTRAQRRNLAKPAVLLGFATCLALAGFLPLLLILSTPLVVDDNTWLLPLCVAIVAGAQYALLISRGERRLYSISFWLFTYLFLGLAPLVQLRKGVTPSTTPGLVESLNRPAFMAILLGMLMFTVGSGIRVKKNMIIRAPQKMNERRVYLVALLCLLFSFYYTWKVGLGNLFVTRDQLSVVRNNLWPDPATQSIISAAGSISLLVPLAGLLQVRRQQSSDGRTPVVLLIVAVAAMLAVTVNPISSARYAFGTAALSAAAMFGAFATPRRIRTSAIVLLVGLILVFPYADRFRSERSGSLLSKGGVTTTLTSGDYDSYAQINNTIYFIDTHGISIGRQAMGVALFWLPRNIWPTKPEDTGIVIAKSRGYGFTNLSAPLWSELLINGGWPLLAGGMGLFGFMCRYADERFVVQAGQSGVISLILPFYLLILLRGSLLQATGGLAVFFGFAMVMQLTTRRRSVAGWWGRKTLAPPAALPSIAYRRLLIPDNAAETPKPLAKSNR